MQGSALGDRGASSRRDKNRAARPPSNIKSRSKNPAILTTWKGLHYDAASSTTTTKVESGSNAVRLRLRSLTWATGQPPSVRMDDEGATTSAAHPIASLGQNIHAFTHG